jgi:hypothetical protein
MYSKQITVPDTHLDTSVDAISMETDVNIRIYGYMSMSTVGDETVWVFYKETTPTVQEVLDKGHPVGGLNYIMPISVQDPNSTTNPSLYWLATTNAAGDLRVIA